MFISLGRMARLFVDWIKFPPLTLKAIKKDGIRILSTRAQVVGEIAARLRRFGVEVEDSDPDQGRLIAHIGAVLEEAAELLAAASEKSNLQMIDAIADLQYAAATLGERLQYDTDAALNAVHNSNMTKTPGPDSAGRAVKGEGYIKPEAELALLVEGL